MTPHKMRIQDSRMVWMDLEMTGLDPEKSRIIEMATLVTDSELNIIEEGPSFIIHQPLEVLRAMDNWNRSQHKKSGLIDAVKKSKMTVRRAERETLAFLKKHCPPRSAPLCGNSIHHDRRFLAKYMPRIHRYLHYRMVDVSSVKDLVKRWYDPRIRPPVKKSGHRAMQDIIESIDELRFYREHFFVPKEDLPHYV
ncbi:MAG: oligoribonuclease [Candidatus Omnitrophota bacterium]